MIKPTPLTKEKIIDKICMEGRASIRIVKLKVISDLPVKTDFRVPQMVLKKDILAACEHLKKNLCDCENISEAFDKCHTCKVIEKSFKGVFK